MKYSTTPLTQRKLGSPNIKFGIFCSLLATGLLLSSLAATAKWDFPGNEKVNGKQPVTDIKATVLPKIKSASQGKPLSFMENKGQVRDQFHFSRHDVQYSMSAGNGLNIFIGNGAIHYQFSKAEETANGATEAAANFNPAKPFTRNNGSTSSEDRKSRKFSMYRMDVELVGANKNAQVITEEKQAYTETYTALGAGVTVGAYNRITYKNVYPRIDWVLYSSGGQLKHEFVVHNGGRVSDIQLKYGGATGLKLDEKGGLIAETPQGTISEQAPYTYEKGGKQVASSFKLTNDVLSYETGNYSGDLVIDPTLAWATYYGGDGDVYAYYGKMRVTTDASGNVFLAGTTNSASAIATTGAHDETYNDNSDGYLVKFNASGVRQWGTYIGGEDWDSIYDLATDSDGNVYVVGNSPSTTGIATAGAYQETPSYGAFMMKLDGSGALVWGTYYGETNANDIGRIAIDNSNNIYIAGYCYGATGIATTGADDETFGGASDAFIAKFTTAGARVWGTYLGGSDEELVGGLSVGDDGSIFITGSTKSTSGITTTGAYHETYNGGTNDAYLVKYNSAGVKQWGTYYEGQPAAGPWYPAAGGYLYSVVADHSGNAYVAVHSTNSVLDIATPGGYIEEHFFHHGGYNDDGYLFKFSSAGAKLWGTFLNDRSNSYGISVSSIGVDTNDNVILVGDTYATSDVATPGAYQSTKAGYYDGFLLKMSPAGLPVYGTYFGGIDHDEMTDVAIDGDGNIYVAGYTYSSAGIATPGAHQETKGGELNAFLTKFTNEECSYADPGTVTGPSVACAGGFYYAGEYPLTATVPGGEWFCSNYDSCDVYEGVFYTLENQPITTTIRYRVGNSCGWAYANDIDVVVTNPIGPGTLSGNDFICEGDTATLSSTVSGGTWTSSNPAVASIGSATGLMTGISAGTASMTYTTTETCGSIGHTMEVFIADTVGVDPISGTLTLCTGNTTDLDDATGGGTWVSSNTSVATVTYASGVVTGVGVGTTIITYTVLTCSSLATTTVVVTVGISSDPGTITGTPTVCVGATTTLSNAVGGGTWSSSNTGVATVGTSGIVTGVSGGSSTITYSVAGGGCGAAFTTQTVTVNPTADAGTITGTATVCTGNTTTLSNAVSGGAWSSSTPSVATVGTSGIVSAVSAGIATITYSVSGCGAAFTTQGVTVNAAPDAGTITGTATVCVGNTTTLSNATGGGVWSSGATGIATVGTSGVVTGVSGGNATISYTVTSSCGSVSTTQVVTVNSSPSAGTITGTATVCTGNTTTLSNATGGGVWSSGATGIATVGTGGIVTGVSAGNATISYTVTDGCGSTSAIRIVTVNSSPGAGTITGTASVCTGNTTTLSNATGGGVWSSGATGIATVGTGGIVTGVSAGNATISYTVTNGCGAAVATQVVTVNAAPNAGTITGASSVDIGSTISLSDAAGGGVWSASNGNATVGTSGVVTGVMAGNVIISYTVTNGCGSASATKSVTVNAAPLDGISGTLVVCVASTTALSHTTGGGTWSSSDAGIASVGVSTGVVTGITAGTATISYYVSGAYATAVVTVNAQPDVIGGATSVCLNETTTLTDATGGGAWSSDNASIASVDGSGVVTGATVGSTTISYTLGTGCYRTQLMTVKPLPTAIAGTASVCEGSTTTLTNSTTIGLSWTSSNTSVATIGVGNGVVTGVAAGTAKITYTINTGCYSTRDVTVTATPATISGTLFTCAGTTTNLSTSPAGGTWSSSNTAVATVGTSGIVTGNAGGYVTITYTLSGGCRRTAAVTVGAVPAAITGTMSMCLGGTTTLHSASPGCTWSSDNTSVATISSGGVVTSVSGGTATISYTHPLGCARTAEVTVNAALPAITGTFTVCVGATVTLSNAAGGGAWTGSNASKATVNSASGVVLGKTAGTVNISYSLGSGCSVGTTVTVVGLPAAITGTLNVCEGATTALSNATGGGTWASSNGTLATVDGSGVVSGLSAGTPIITYTANGCFKTTNVTVKPLPSAILGNMGVCIGSSSTATCPSPYGISWTSSNTSIVTIGASSGLITGVAAGNATITYLNHTGCVSTRQVTVSAAPDAGTISGATTVIIGNTIPLSSTVLGGVWSSADAGIASVDAGTGVVTGVSAGGPIDITYTANNGCGSAFSTYGVSVTVSRPGIQGSNNEPGVSSIKLYPNPTSGVITIESPTSGVFTVYTLDGRQVMSTAVEAIKTTISLPNNLSSGIYMCRFNGNDGSTTMVRLVYE